MSEVHVREVQVKTMSVEIRALTLNGKQMTLSVFKQLPGGAFLEKNYNKKKEEYEYTFCPGGIPWGYVRHHPDRMCRILDPHLHLVWQWEGKLYRDYVNEDDIRAINLMYDLDQLFIAV
jgi:hypothetical protein